MTVSQSEMVSTSNTFLCVEQIEVPGQVRTMQLKLDELEGGVEERPLDFNKEGHLQQKTVSFSVFLSVCLCLALSVSLSLSLSLSLTFKLSLSLSLPLSLSTLLGIMVQVAT